MLCLGMFRMTSKRESLFILEGKKNRSKVRNFTAIYYFKILSIPTSLLFS